MTEICDEEVLQLFRSQLPFSEERNEILSTNSYVYVSACGGVHTKEEFVPKDNDIFLVSYPKSGTTWAADILSLIVSGGKPEPKKRALFTKRVHHLVYFSSFVKTLKTAILNLDFTIFGVAIFTYFAQFFERKPAAGERRIIFTHLLSEFLPKETQKGKHKIIYVTRNPKDNMVSFYHFYKTFVLLKRYNLTWNQHFQIYMAGKGIQGSWWDHVQSYCNLQKTNANILLLKYEDMKKDVPGAVRELADFIGVKLDRNQCETIAQVTDFKTTKTTRENADRFTHIFTRKGVVGDWKNHFTVAQNRKFHEIYGYIMTKLPVEYDYD